MKTRFIKGWRIHSSEEHHGRKVEPKWDFTELLKVMQVWAR